MINVSYVPSHLIFEAQLDLVNLATFIMVNFNHSNYVLRLIFWLISSGKFV